MSVAREYAPTSRITPSEEHFAADLGGEHVILSLVSERYYGLADVASRVWELIQDSATVGQVEETLMAEYEVEPERCRRDVQRFLGDLVGRGLITISGEPGS